MEYKELVRELAQRSNVTIKDTTYIMDNLRCIIEDELLDGNTIILLGLFSIGVHEVKSKKYIDINTKEVTECKKHKKIKIKINRDFKNKIKL